MRTKEIPDLQFKNLEQRKQNHPNFTTINVILYYKRKPFLGKTSSLKSLFLQNYHESLGRHAGAFKTLKRIKQNVHWEGIKQDIKEYVSACHTCQQTKYIPQRPLRLLHFNTNNCLGRHIFRLHSQFTCIQQTYSDYVVIDRFSKAAHFGTIITHFIVCQAAELFTNIISEHHGDS